MPIILLLQAVSNIYINITDMDETNFERKATEVGQMNHKFETNVKNMKKMISYKNNKEGVAIR